jgi:D-hexose-6-phosphate mutarotase
MPPVLAVCTTGDNEYKEMVCIEAAAVERTISVAAGEQWEAGQTLTAGSV